MTAKARFDHLDDAALDALPFGVVRVGVDGKIVRYNRAEAERAGMQRWRVLGRDFFRELVGDEGAALAREVESVPPGKTLRVQHTFRRYRRETPVVIDVERTCDEGAYLSIRPL